MIGLDTCSSAGCWSEIPEAEVEEEPAKEVDEEWR